MKCLRRISALSRDSLRGVQPRAPGTPPTIEYVKPADLYIEESYQRDMTSEGSTALVRKIISDFRWSHFKPPICVHVKDPDALVVIDGQHTATAAASNPNIDLLPVIVVDASELSERAAAFVGHNRERLALTPMAIYRGELAAGDEIAVRVDAACRAAGASVLLKPMNLRDKAEVGATMAVGALRSIAKVNGQDILTRILRLLVKAGRGPIKSQEIRAVQRILLRSDRPGLDDEIAKIVASKPAEKWTSMALAEASESGDKIAEALATVWLRALDLRLPSARPAPAPKPPARPKPTSARPKAAAERPFIPPLPPIPAMARVPPMPPLSFETPAAAPPPVQAKVSNGGVVVDIATGEITRGHKRVTVPNEQARLVATLLRVMPSLLPIDRIAPKVWGRDADAEAYRLAQLADDTNQALALVGLKVRQQPKIGFAISDL